MDSAAELGRNPVSKHQIRPEYGNEQADAGRDCRARLARPNSQARRRTGKYSFFLFSWPRAGLATLPGWSILLLHVWPYNAAILPVVTKNLPNSPRFTPYEFLSRCKSSTLTTRQQMDDWILLTHVVTLSATDARIKILLWQESNSRLPHQQVCRLPTINRLDHSGDKCWKCWKVPQVLYVQTRASITSLVYFKTLQYDTTVWYT